MSLGKRQLNQLIGFLDKSGSVKDSLGGRENPAFRTVRAKREADEAGAKRLMLIHALLLVIVIPNIFRPRIPERCSLAGNITVASHENIRRWLQGTILVSSTSYLLYPIQSLEMFVEESSTVIKKVLEKYADNMTYVFLKFVM